MLWHVLDTAEGSPPLPLNLAEVMALYFSCSLLKQVEHTVFHNAMDSLFSKIRAMLPVETADFLDATGRSLHVGFMPRKRSNDIGPVIDSINTAVSQKSRVRIHYYTISRKRTTTREVAPYNVFFHNGTFYLIGHCFMRNSVRTFAIDRIQSVTLTGEKFTIPLDFDIKSYTGGSFGVFQGPPVRVRIRFAPAVAGYISEKQWHPSQRITPGEGGAVYFEATVAGTREIKFWVLQWGAQAKVLQPASLQKEIEDEIRNMQTLYTDKGHGQ